MRLFNSFIQFLLPDCCLLCGQGVFGSRSLCQDCGVDLPWLTGSCYHCALPLASPWEGVICGQCQQSPPPFTRCVAGFVFTYPVDNLIRDYKYRRRLGTGRLLAELLGQQLSEAYQGQELPQVITAVPLHWRRLLNRGFNQAALTARQLGKQLRIPVRNLSRRVRHTPHQQGAGRRQRLHNLYDVFQVTGAVSGQHIALVDDVVTTGATASELTRALLDTGARRVDVWALARTPSPLFG